MPRQEKVIVVFVASPSDLEPERNCLEEVIQELNRSWPRSMGLRLELVRWNLGGARTFARIGLGIITGCSGRPGPRHRGGTGLTSLALELSWPGPLP